MRKKNLSNHQFPLQLSKAGAIDIHKDKIVGCILQSGEDAIFKECSSMTKDLYQLKEWFSEHQIHDIVMESTGNYWYTLYSILAESGIQVTLANPALCKQIPGRKTDMNDAHWLCKLLVNGLIKKSFVAGEEQQYLRDLTRSRLRYTQLVTQAQNRILKILESCNIKLRSVLSSMSTQSAMAIVEAIAEGKQDKNYLISLLKGKAKKKAGKMRDALDGRVTSHHQKMIQFYLEDYKHNENQIKLIETELSAMLQCSKEQKIESLQKIDGIGKHAAEVIIAELGDDMSYFPSADHAASWSGLAPGNAESAGKKRHIKVRQGNPYLRVIMVQVAWAASRTKNSYWYASYKALCNRLPKKKAIVAIARKMIKVVYKTLKTGYEYQRWTVNDFFEIKKGRRDLGIKTC